MKDRTNLFSRLFIGIKKGVMTPTLPDNILKLQSNPFIRILRVLGGLSILILLSINKFDYSLHIFIIYLLLFIVFLFLVYHIIISYYRIKHIIKILNSKDLDIYSSSSGLFLIQSRLSDKIPNWLKWIFRLLLLGVVLSNVIGFSGASTILVNTLLFFKMYTKIILISLCLLVIISQFLAIFYLYRVKDKQELVLPFGKYTPNYLVDLLRSLKLLSSTKESIDAIKKDCSIQIVLYLVIIILIVLFL